MNARALFLAGIACSVTARAAEPMARSDPPQSIRVTDARFDQVAGTIRTAVENGSIPSASVAVALGGRIVFEAAFGWADREALLAATPDTVYALASVTKPLTATAVMVLVEQGLVHLDEGVANYGPFALRTVDGAEAKVAVRHLLNQTSGLPTYLNLFYPDERLAPAPFAATIRRYGVTVFPAGAQFEYSNLGYGILGELIAAASERPLAQFLQDAVFAPLGMTSTTISLPPATSHTVATAYDARGRPAPHFLTDTPGAGDGFSTAHDLIVFALMHLEHRAQGQGQVLEHDSIARMQSGFEPGAAYHYYDGARYGFGWYLTDDPERHRIVWHEGGAFGASAAIKQLPEHDAACVVLLNAFRQELCTSLADALIRAVLPAHTARSPADTARFQPYSASAEWLGKWAGEITTPEVRVPIALVFESDGLVRATFADDGLASFFTGALPIEHATLLNSVMRDGDRLMGWFGGRLPGSDLSRGMDHFHRLVLVRGNDSLQGFVTALAADARERYGFSYPVLLTRTPAPK
ncbi:MAG: serine hydrolase domain-containing protein [Planctomycetota bacterium]